MGLEIERKFLVRKHTFLMHINTKIWYKAYIAHLDGRSVRIRSPTTSLDNYKGTKTTKGMSRFEWNQRLTEKMS